MSFQVLRFRIARSLCAGAWIEAWFAEVDVEVLEEWLEQPQWGEWIRW